MTGVMPKENGTVNLQVGCGFVKEKNARKGEKEMFDAMGMPIKHKLAEFRVTEDGILPVRSIISVAVVGCLSGWNGVDSCAFRSWTVC